MPRPGGGVLAVDDAEVGAELLAQRRQPRLDRPAAGRAEHVGDEEDAQRLSPARASPPRMHLDDDVVPRVVRVARERLALGVREVDDACRASSRRRSPASRRRATGRRARARPRRRATARRSAGCRCASRGAAVQHDVVDRDDRPVDGRVDVGARRARRRRSPTSAGPSPPGSWYQRGAPDEPPKIACAEPAQQALVRLRAERVERERAVAAALVADRGHAALADRQLEVERAEPGDDLRLRRPGRAASRDGARRRGDGGRACPSRRRRTGAASRAPTDGERRSGRRGGEGAARAPGAGGAERRARRDAARRLSTGGDIRGTVADALRGLSTRRRPARAPRRTRTTSPSPAAGTRRSRAVASPA